MLVQDNLESIQYILHKHNVKHTFVFGSVCTENFNDNSDKIVQFTTTKTKFQNLPIAHITFLFK